MFSNVAKIVETLTDHEVRFVVIGGVALVLQGSSRTTQDLDLCYDRSEDNLDRLAAVRLYGRDLQVLSLDGLEKAKRAVGRLKDLADLEIIQRLKNLEP